MEAEINQLKRMSMKCPAFDTEYHALMFAVSKLEEFKRMQEHEQSLLTIVRTLKNEKGALQIQVIHNQRELQEINAKLERYSTSYTEMSKRCEELSDLRRASDAGRERLRKRVQLLISALRQAKIDSNAAIMRLQGVVKRLQEKLGKCFQQAMEVPEPEPVNDTQFATMTGAGFFLTHYYNNYAQQLRTLAQGQLQDRV